MTAQRYWGETGPVTWIGRVPIYLATIFAAIQAAGMVVTALAAGTGAGALIGALRFEWGSATSSGFFWQFVTYPLVTPPDIWLFLQLVMLAMFGAEVEKYLGRKAFFWLLVVLVLAGPLLVGFAKIFGGGMVLAGGGAANFAVFAAFALLYPRAEILFGIQARWIAIALLAIASLQYFSGRDFTGLTLILGQCAAALLFLRWEGVASLAGPIFGGDTRPREPRAKRRNLSRKLAPPVPSSPDVHESIDPILEKISRNGISSLSPDERARLERARAKLIENESPGPR